jgi:hypothetical protein
MLPTGSSDASHLSLGRSEANAAVCPFALVEQLRSGRLLLAGAAAEQHRCHCDAK